MNFRSIVIIALAVVVAIAIVAIIFFYMLLKESALAPAPTPASEVTQTRAAVIYQIPENVIPSEGQIEESVKEEVRKRKESDRAITEITTKRASLREQIRREAEAVDRNAISLTKSGTPQIKSAVTRTVSVIPKEEKNRQLKAKGLFAY